MSWERYLVHPVIPPEIDGCRGKIFPDFPERVAKRKPCLISWYTLSMIAILLMGTQRFLYKVSAQRGCNFSWTTFTFMALSYFLGTLFSWVLRNRLGEEERDGGHRDAVMIGVGMGLLNFAGFYAFLSALTIGPLSLMVSMVGLHFVIPIILCAIVYSEKLTPARVLGALLTVVSVIFLRF